MLRPHLPFVPGKLSLSVLLTRLCWFSSGARSHCTLCTVVTVPPWDSPMLAHSWSHTAHAPLSLPGPTITHTYLTGLPGTPRVGSCPGETRGVLYPYGYGSCYCLQQRAGFRFQHRGRHSSEHYHRRKCECASKAGAADANPRPGPFYLPCTRSSLLPATNWIPTYFCLFQESTF